MSYDVTTTFADIQTDVEALDPVHFFVVNASQSGTDYQYYVDWNHDVTGYKLDSSGDLLDATTCYIGFPIKGDVLKSNIDGEISGITLVIPNVDRVMEGILHSQEYLRGKDIYVMTAFARNLPSGVGYTFIGTTPDKRSTIKEKFYIDSASSSEQAVVFNCKSKFDIKRAQIPGRTFSHECQWEYNDTSCGVQAGYFATYPTCDLSINDCKERVNASRFGGFLSIPRKSFYVAR